MMRIFLLDSCNNNSIACVFQGGWDRSYHMIMNVPLSYFPDTRPPCTLETQGPLQPSRESAVRGFCVSTDGPTKIEVW